MAVDKALVSYLEDVLARARRGEVVAFVGSAATVALTPADLIAGKPARVDAKVLVGASFERDNASRLQRKSLESLVASLFDGAGASASAVQNGLEQDATDRLRSTS